MKGTADGRLPLTALLALAMAGFITILTGALPAGLLPQMAQGLAVSEAWIGQTVTVYAIGSLVAAIPLTASTQGVRRRPLLLAAIAGFVVANTVTAFSGSYALTLVARFLAGVSAGLLWALLAGYAARMVPDHQKGRAIAVAMVGTPLALSLGVPAGTFLGTLVGWRRCFGTMSAVALLLMVWVRVKVPDFAGQVASRRLALRQVFTLAGVRPVLCAVLAFVLAHNILYTYIAPFLASVGMAERTASVLLVFGITSLLGIWITGVLVDLHLRALTLGSTVVLGLAALALGLAGDLPVVVYSAVAAWGLAFGGAATLFQTTLAKTAADAADVAQSMLVTAWNAAIAGGGIVGGALLGRFGACAFAPALVGLLAATLVVVWSARRHAFPQRSGCRTRMRRCRIGRREHDHERPPATVPSGGQSRTVQRVGPMACSGQRRALSEPLCLTGDCSGAGVRSLRVHRCHLLRDTPQRRPSSRPILRSYSRSYLKNAS